MKYIKPIDIGMILGVLILSIGGMVFNLAIGIMILGLSIMWLSYEIFNRGDD